MSQPQVTIIIPFYNAANYIAAAIDSVRQQVFSDWQLILVDDGSTDDGADCCKAAAAHDERIELLQTPHVGVGLARNVGIEHARGEWICFIDADDKVDSDYLEAFVREDRRDVDLVVVGYAVERIDKAGKVVSSSYRVPSRAVYKIDEIDDGLLEPIFTSGLMHMVWNKAFRSSVIRKYRIEFCDYPVNEDFIFVLDYMEHVRCFVSLDNAPYHWCRRMDVLTGVESIPHNIVAIYNESHCRLQELFGRREVVDRIMYYSYNLVTHKLLTSVQKNRMSFKQAKHILVSIADNKLVKSAYRAYRPKSFGEWIFYIIERLHWFRVELCLYRLLRNG